jgi:hypothetical protein
MTRELLLPIYLSELELQEADTDYVSRHTEICTLSPALIPRVPTSKIPALRAASSDLIDSSSVPALPFWRSC